MAEDLKVLTRRWFEEVWNKGRPEAIDEMFDADGVAYGLSEDGEPLKGRDGFKTFHAAYTNAFPDMRIQVDDVIQEGDKAAVRFSGTATHSGDGIGISATNRPVTFTGMSFTRWRNGKIIEGWNNVDIAGIMNQIGAA
jgi:steroid delta-isomerase-like uncharacterized protein